MTVRNKSKGLHKIVILRFLDSKGPILPSRLQTMQQVFVEITSPIQRENRNTATARSNMTFIFFYCLGWMHIFSFYWDCVNSIIWVLKVTFHVIEFLGLCSLYLWYCLIFNLFISETHLRFLYGIRGKATVGGESKGKYANSSRELEK